MALDKPRINATVSGSTVATAVTADDLEVDSGTLSIDADNNRVGINTTSPAKTLGVDGDLHFQPTAISTSHITTAGSLDIRADNNIKIGTDGADSIRLGRVNSTAVKVHLRSGTDNDVVISNSKVGIGTDSPSEALQVVGNVTLSGELDAATLDISGNCDIDGITNLDNTDIDGTLVVDGTNISLDSTSTLNIDNSNTSNGITIGTATSGVPVSIGHTTSETTVNDNLIVTGDLTVNGTTTTINSTTLTVDDKVVVIASGAGDSAAADGAGISVDGASATFLYDHTGTQWEMNKPLEVTGSITSSAAVVAASLDISGDCDIDGTMEADAITVDGTALNEFIADTVGAMVGSNTESGITVAYEDGDNTLDFTVGTLNQDTTGTAAIATTVTCADESSDTSCFVGYVTAATGDLGIKTGSNLTFNSSNGTLGATEFSGGGVGITGLNGTQVTSGTVAAARVATLNQDTTGTAAIATTVTVADESSDTSCNVLFTTAATGDLAPKSGTNLTFNSADGTLTATNLAGTLTTAAQTNITSVGTIGTGVWQGTAVASAYLDADTAHLSGTQTFSGAKTFSADVVISGATPQLTIGDAGAEDTFLVFDGNAQDYRIGIDDGTDTLEIGLGAAHGTTPVVKIDSATNLQLMHNSAVADGQYSGTLAMYQAGEDLTAGEVVYFKSDGKVWKAVATAAATSRCVAMAMETTSADAMGPFLLKGFARFNSEFPTWTIGGALFTPEAETSSKNVPEQAAPDTDGDFVQVIGYAISADAVYFDPDSTVVEVA